MTLYDSAGREVGRKVVRGDLSFFPSRRYIYSRYNVGFTRLQRRGEGRKGGGKRGGYRSGSFG